MERISVKIIKSDSIGLFHDSRGDTKKLAVAVNILINKVNELVEEINQLKKLNTNGK